MRISQRNMWTSTKWSGEVDKLAVLYVPTVYAMDDATIAALKEYVKQGGTLWADGPTG